MTKTLRSAQKRCLEAAKLIEEKGWCQGVEAMDELGWACDVNSEHAVAFSLTGAIERVILDAECYDAGIGKPIYQRLDAAIAREITETGQLRYEFVSDAEYFQALQAWNDQKGRTKKQVVDKLYTATTVRNPDPYPARTR